ncbi:DUF2243 domain-containing protein [Peribacillus kribbensis]|uniref:DUF2243 domain-containing protein n=1 Tax=Peribacillus kribbensis TaxID=356658 RepID=UPI00047E13AC|nr:DUF2243 domain-containing protein [Peribacillus kribbensis]
MRVLGALAGFLLTDFLFHLVDAFAAGFKAETPAGRIGAVFSGVLILLVFMFFIRRFFSRSFFNGFTVAVGLFLSFDIVVFHWIFQLHRITNGPEANWLEPLFVLGGLITIWFGLKQEKGVSGKQQSPDNRIA